MSVQGYSWSKSKKKTVQRGFSTTTCFNPLVYKSNYSATPNKYEVGTLAVDVWTVAFGTARRGRSPPRPLLAVPNVTAYPVLPNPLLCGLNLCPLTKLRARSHRQLQSEKTDEVSLWQVEA